MPSAPPILVCLLSGPSNSYFYEHYGSLDDPISAPTFNTLTCIFKSLSVKVNVLVRMLFEVSFHI